MAALSTSKHQAFTNCKHGYNRIHNVHTHSVTCARKWCYTCKEICARFSLRRHLRTTYCLPMQNIMLQENKNEHYHSLFSFQNNCPKSLSYSATFDPQSLVPLQPYLFKICLIDMSQSDLMEIQYYSAMCKQQLNWNFLE